MPRRITVPFENYKSRLMGKITGVHVHARVNTLVCALLVTGIQLFMF